jgi:hypothetical protein
MQLAGSDIDALLIHCYWFDDQSKNLLDTHSNLQLLAVACLLKKPGINKVIILGGKIDPNKESIGSVMGKELLQKLGNKFIDKLIVTPNSITTRQEVEEFQKLTIKNRWQNIACLSFSNHLPRVKRAYKRIFGEEFNKIRFLKTEEVLKQCGHKKKVLKYINSPNSKLLKSYESLIGSIDRIPLIGGYLIDMMIKVFPRKGAFLSKRLFN